MFFVGCCTCVHDGRSLLSLEGVMWLLHDGWSMLCLSGCSCFIVFYAKLLLLLICLCFFSVCIPYPAQGHINPMLKLAKLLISVILRCSTLSINYLSYSSHQWCWSSSVMAILWCIFHFYYYFFSLEVCWLSTSLLTIPVCFYYYFVSLEKLGAISLSSHICFKNLCLLCSLLSNISIRIRRPLQHPVNNSHIY